jgi:hypothetical protein
MSHIAASVRRPFRTRPLRYNGYRRFHRRLISARTFGAQEPEFIAIAAVRERDSKRTPARRRCASGSPPINIRAHPFGALEQNFQ